MTTLVNTGRVSYTERVQRNPNRWGHLITPRGLCARATETSGMIGVDNDRFNESYDEAKFLRTVEYASQFGSRVRFVAAPDVVCDGPSTLKEFESWSPRIRAMSMPVALVLQNGMKPDLIPWDACDAVFVGGDDEWKEGLIAASIIREAKQRGLWVHIGRVNSLRRMNLFRGIQADSMDGTYFSKHELAATELFERGLNHPVNLRMF